MDDERRKNDEAFRLRIIEQQAEIKALLTQADKSLREIHDQLNTHGLKIVDLEHALWGGPGVGDIGLLERHRRLARNWTIAVALSAFLFSALGRIISPLYDKWIADWAFNSVSERWEREQKRPRVTHYHIHETVTPSGD
jgi:hypothetical protein